jgi:hypothetical protein
MRDGKEAIAETDGAVINPCLKGIYAGHNPVSNNWLRAPPKG